MQIRKVNVLLVDDQPDIRKLLRMTLECYKDVRIFEACDGMEGWKKAEIVLPEVMIVDAMMPGINGIELCEKIKKSPKMQHTKVIICSARASSDDINKGRRAGCDVYLTKPFSPIALLNTMDDMISLQR